MEDALKPFGGAPETGDDRGDLLVHAAKRAGVTVIATACCPSDPLRTWLDRPAQMLQAAGGTIQRIMLPYSRLTCPFGPEQNIVAIPRDLNPCQTEGTPHD